MKAPATLFLCAGLLLLGPAAATFEECKTQTTFDIRMCESHMCTACTLASCPEACQEIQEAHPECRCRDWPAARKSYSGGEFKGKGNYGDVGDYSKVVQF